VSHESAKTERSKELYKKQLKGWSSQKAGERGTGVFAVGCLDRRVVEKPEKSEAVFCHRFGRKKDLLPGKISDSQQAC